MSMFQLQYVPTRSLNATVPNSVDQTCFKYLLAFNVFLFCRQTNRSAFSCRVPLHHCPSQSAIPVGSGAAINLFVWLPICWVQKKMFLPTSFFVFYPGSI